MPSKTPPPISECAVLRPEDVLPWQSFKRLTGLGDRTIREAKARGIEPAFLRVGRCKYVRGRDAIAYLETLAAA